jgi:hypothetical protein
VGPRLSVSELLCRSLHPHAFLRHVVVQVGPGRWRTNAISLHLEDEASVRDRRVSFTGRRCRGFFLYLVMQDHIPCSGAVSLMGLTRPIRQPLPCPTLLSSSTDLPPPSSLVNTPNLEVFLDNEAENDPSNYTWI